MSARLLNFSLLLLKFVDICGIMLTEVSYGGEFMVKRVISLLLVSAMLLILPAVPVSADGADSVSAASAVTYSGPFVQVGGVTLPLAEHMPGTYFTRDGKACDCHYSVDCIANGSGCNCMRYYPTGNKETCEIDLLGVQCFGFARLVFYKCFGFIDSSANSSLFYSVGSLSSSQVNESSVKNLLMKAAPGAHVRLAQGHSVSILSMDDDFIVIYHANAGGDGVTTEPCIVSTRRYTWAQFATAAASGILYVNMPYNYPDSSIILTEKSTGHYKITSDNGLHHRVATNTQSESYGVIPYGTIIKVTEIDGFWGKTVYNGKTGWVFLEYTTFYSALSISPSGSVFVRGSDGYIRGTAWKMDFDGFTEHFDKQSLIVTSSSGKDLSAGGYISTGTKVSLLINGEVFDTAVVCLAGDVNCNGILDVGDYLITRRAFFGTFELSAEAKAAADVNGSGDLDSMDYILIRRYFFSPNTSLLRLSKTVFDGKALGRACANGLSELMGNVSLHLVGMLYNLQLMKYAGEGGVAAYGVMSYFNTVFLSVFFGYTNGTAPIVSYHFGAKNHRELKGLLKKSFAIIGVASVGMFTLAQILAVPLANVFLSYDAELLDLTIHGFRIFAFSFLFVGFGFFTPGFFTALNDAATSATISMMRTMVAQVLSVLLLPLVWGVDGIFASIVMAEIMAMTMAFIFLVVKRKKYHYWE